MTTAFSLQELYGRTTRGIRFDLERIAAVLRVVGDPHLCAPAVLIGGTNGKGSLTAMWAAALAAQGLRVGKYTSPHLLRFNERIVVDGELASDGALDALFARLHAAEAQTGIRLTFFEAATWMAFVHFADAQVEAMVLEVGLGGRLDATNVSDPVLSILTSVGLDHTEYLGATLAAIASEKAQIGRAGRPLVCNVSADLLPVVTAHAQGAKIFALGRDSAAFPVLPPAMQGIHQQHNAALFALSATAAAGTPLALSRAAYSAGLQAEVPGRYEVRVLDLHARDGSRAANAGADFGVPPATGVQPAPHAHATRLIIDGAHNGHAATALAASLRADPAFGHPRALIFGGTAGRPPATTLGVLAPLFDRVILCPPQSERALSLEDMRAVAANAITTTTMHAALNEAAVFPHVVIAGSLYLAGDALAALGGGRRETVADFR